MDYLKPFRNKITTPVFLLEEQVVIHEILGNINCFLTTHLLDELKICYMFQA